MQPATPQFAKFPLKLSD